MGGSDVLEKTLGELASKNVATPAEATLSAAVELLQGLARDAAFDPEAAPIAPWAEEIEAFLGTSLPTLLLHHLAWATAACALAYDRLDVIPRLGRIQMSTPYGSEGSIFGLVDLRYTDAFNRGADREVAPLSSGSFQAPEHPGRVPVHSPPRRNPK
jgi:hypothetical protein